MLVKHIQIGVDNLGGNAGQGLSCSSCPHQTMLRHILGWPWIWGKIWARLSVLLLVTDVSTITCSTTYISKGFIGSLTGLGHRSTSKLMWFVRWIPSRLHLKDLRLIGLLLVHVVANEMQLVARLPKLVVVVRHFSSARRYLVFWGSPANCTSIFIGLWGCRRRYQRLEKRLVLMRHILGKFALIHLLNATRW